MWATTENQGNFLGRISIRRNQVASAEGDVDDLEFFQRKIAERFSDLVPSSSSTSSSTHQKDQQSQSSLPPHPPSSADLSNEASSTPEGAADAALSSAVSGAAVSDPLMSISWLRKLLDAFLCCEAEFKATLLMGRDPSHIVKSPLDRLIPELLDRTVKALDICNAITHGVEAIRYVQMHAEIAVSALEERPFTDGQVGTGQGEKGASVSDELNRNRREGIEREQVHGAVMVLRTARPGHQRPPHLQLPVTLLERIQELVSSETDPGDLLQSVPATWRRVDRPGNDRLHNERSPSLRDLDPGGGHTLPGTGRAWGPYPNTETAGLGPRNVGPPGEDRRRVEEEGEERRSWPHG